MITGNKVPMHTEAAVRAITEKQNVANGNYMLCTMCDIGNKL